MEEENKRILEFGNLQQQREEERQKLQKEQEEQKMALYNKVNKTNTARNFVYYVTVNYNTKCLL